MEEILAITLLFGGGTVFLLSISPIGRAIASRIQGRVPGQKEVLQRLDEMEQWIVSELDEMRQHVTELDERLDFTERALTKQRDEKALPGNGQMED